MVPTSRTGQIILEVILFIMIALGLIFFIADMHKNFEMKTAHSQFHERGFKRHGASYNP